MGGTYQTVRYRALIWEWLATRFGEEAALMERWHEVGLGTQIDGKEDLRYNAEMIKEQCLSNRFHST